MCEFVIFVLGISIGGRLVIFVFFLSLSLSLSLKICPPPSYYNAFPLSLSVSLSRTKEQTNELTCLLSNCLDYLSLSVMNWLTSLLVKYLVSFSHLLICCYFFKNQNQVFLCWQIMHRISFDESKFN